RRRRRIREREQLALEALRAVRPHVAHHRGDRDGGAQRHESARHHSLGGSAFAAFSFLLPPAFFAAPREIVTFLMVTGSVGMLRAPVGTRAIFISRSSGWHCPKMVCLPLSHGVAFSVMKDCDPLVPGPRLAIARMPPLSIVSDGSNSSPNS